MRLNTEYNVRCLFAVQVGIRQHRYHTLSDTHYITLHCTQEGQEGKELAKR